MGLKRKGLEARRDKRAKWSRNSVAARERLRLARAADADARMEREIAEAKEWEKRNPIPKLPPAARIRIEIPGMPSKSITVRRWEDGRILAGNQITTAKQLGRKLGVLLDQFL